MELVYLWVEEYKNIKNQGFNFSPRFTCKYENGALTICDKKKIECQDNDYMENLFGQNINITAIVGENGAGKSSILEIIKCKAIHREEKSAIYLAVFFDSEKYFCYGTINDFKYEGTMRQLSKICSKYILNHDDLYHRATCRFPQTTNNLS